MRVLASFAITAAACSTQERSAEFLEPADGAQLPGNLAEIRVLFGSDVPGRYLSVTDDIGNDFTSLKGRRGAGSNERFTDTYPLPAGRTLMAEAGFTPIDTGVREPLASVTFTMSASDPCQMVASTSSAVITSPIDGQIVPLGTTVVVAAAFSGAVTSTQTYVYFWHNDQGGHTGFDAGSGAILPSGRVFTAEAGLYCGDFAQGLWPFYPLAAVEFSTE